MITGIIAIVVGFLIVLSVLIYFVAGIRGKFLWRVLAVVCLWYGVVVFYSVLAIQGWPARSELPQEAYVQSYIIEEPVAMYFWLQCIDEQPRSYVIDYDRELHKRLAEGKKKSKRTGGRMILKNLLKPGVMQKLRRGNQKSNDNVQFEITNPQEQLKKD